MSPSVSPRIVAAVATVLAAAALSGGRIAPAELSREDELARVRDRIRELEVRAASLERERRSLEADLVRLEVDLDLRRARLDEARLALGRARRRMAALEDEMEALRVALGERRDRLAGRVHDLYRLDRQGGLRLLLSDRRRAEAQPAMRLLRYHALRESRAVAGFLEDRRALEEKDRELRLQELEADLWVRTEREGLVELGELRARKAALVRELELRRSEATVAVRELSQREARLETFLQALLGRTPLDGDPIQGYKGILEGPALGSVVRGFGPRTDPRYRTRVPHNGLEYVTLPGAEVRAVYPGTVLYADDLEGYGPTAIVLHPTRVFTLYAGLSRLDVEVDDVVSLGRPVGASPGRFYFEIRVENRPVDPAAWLR